MAGEFGMQKNPSAAPRIRPLAAVDLEETVRYLDSQSSTAADHFLDEFYKSAERLAVMPGLGSIRRTRGRLKGLRSWPLVSFGPYVLFYLPLHRGGVEVVRVLHGAREVNRALRKS
jgi:plasmid stabilization system protein ParE